jgi:class 3 adenylate cyclase
VPALLYTPVVRSGPASTPARSSSGGDDVGGIAVHFAARVMAAAAPGEVLVSGTVHDLVAGSDHVLEDRGAHALKGIGGEWRLFAVRA